MERNQYASMKQGKTITYKNVDITGGFWEEQQRGVRDSTIYLHCYMDCDMQIPMQTGTVRITEHTRYPEDGRIVLTVGTAAQYTLAVRIPGWSKAQTILINGQSAEGELVKGYFHITRNWAEGDEVVLDLNMAPMLVEANPRVKDLVGKTALIKGPVVYCAEGIDNPDTPLRDARLAGVKNAEESSMQIGGRAVPTITVDACRTKWTDGLYRAASDSEGEEPIRLTMIPYHAFANRGLTEMTVWLRK